MSTRQRARRGLEVTGKIYFSLLQQTMGKTS